MNSTFDHRGLRAAPIAALLLLACWASGGSGVAAQDDVRVTVEEGVSLRDLAETHLGDPDLWTEILRANNLESITDVEPGLQLEIPVARISRATDALDVALGAIRDATDEGARLFAPDQINRAISLLEDAKAERQLGAWEGTVSLAGEAGIAAAEALELAKQQRDVAAEAVLSDREGIVEGRTPQEVAWSERELNTLLVEQENVRTLSRSSAQITFRDASRLRLNANSQALIQRIRADPLSRREEAKVSLVEGDFYALLGGKSERRRFELDIPDVETEIDSRSFWVSRDASGAKFANRDERLLRIAAQGSSVSLGRNEAALVRAGEAPSAKIAVLPPPALLEPSDDTVAFGTTLRLRWQEVLDAAGYWIEIAYDRGFDHMAISRWGLTGPRFDAEEVDIGSYYWRVAALDKFGLPSAQSDPWRVHVRVDDTPPFLRIDAPKANEIVRQAMVPIRGESEAGVELLVDGTPVPVAEDGAFETLHQAMPGPNTLALEARDPAGNVSRRSVAFLHLPDAQTAVVFDASLPRLGLRHFVTDRDVASLAGSAAPAAQLVIRDPSGTARATTYTDADGAFTLNVPLIADTEDFGVEVITRSGETIEDGITVSVDREPPRIELDVPPPAITAREWLPLRGRTVGAEALAVNGEPLDLLDGTFDQTVTLQEGANNVELVATDLVGNVRVENFEVELDQVPPELVEHRVSAEVAASGAPVTLEVVAQDSAGLKKAAPFLLQVGAARVSDLLVLNPATDTYRATVFPPAGGSVLLKYVELEDYAGNRRRYTFD